jgi:REP element-mobilizing transposase RayT
MGKEHWFDEAMRDQIVAIIATSQQRSDAQLTAYVVMSNHFHLVIRQGIAPLAQLMHPICRRIALAVKRANGREGHIFERRFRDRPCHDPDHLRNAIVYSHLNPSKARFCDSPGLYRWSSHHAYCGSSEGVEIAAQTSRPHLIPTLELFASQAAADGKLLHDDYNRYVAWRQECDRLPSGGLKPARPPVIYGNEHWDRLFVQPMSGKSRAEGKARPDLRDLALWTIREIDPRLDLELVRSRRGGRALAAVRRAIIKRAIMAGFRGCQIAPFLCVSESTISKVATSLVARPNVRFDS